jgi:hypothetical protein
VACGLLINEMTISRLQAQRILNAAVDFIHAGGAEKVRANYAARRLLRRNHLKVKYYSADYGEVEVKNIWKPTDNACATRAVAKNQAVLGAHRDDVAAVDTTKFSAQVGTMAILYKKKSLLNRFLRKSSRDEPETVETIRSVLCVPVLRSGKGHPIGVITFDDEAKLPDSDLGKRETISAAKKLAARGLSRG